MRLNTKCVQQSDASEETNFTANVQTYSIAVQAERMQQVG